MPVFALETILGGKIEKTIFDLRGDRVLVIRTKRAGFQAFDIELAVGAERAKLKGSGMRKLFLGLGFKSELDIGFLAGLVGQARNLDVYIIQSCLVRLLGLLVDNVNRRCPQCDVLDRISERFGVGFGFLLGFRRFGLSRNVN